MSGPKTDRPFNDGFWDAFVALRKIAVYGVCVMETIAQFSKRNTARRTLQALTADDRKAAY